MSARRGVFLDRDGTLIDELGYLGDPDGVHLYPGAAAAVRALNEAGLPVVLVTNQSGVARGLFTEADVARVHARLARDLAAEGASLDLILSCPHHPEHGAPPYRTNCDCRKPAPGLYERGLRELDLAPERSFAVGDSARDLEGARRARIGNLVLVATGKGSAEDTRLRAEGKSDHAFVPDLAAAVRWILADCEAR
jgi:D-glycero-D-manno-heptose 1,7-bisphosphate phosphatase